MYFGTKRFLNHCADIGGNATCQAPPAERAHHLLPPDHQTGASHLMAVPYPNQLPLHNVSYAFAVTHERMREDIASLRHSAFASRRTIADAQEAIARADKVLARRIWD